MKKGYIYILLSAIIFSTIEIAGKTIADSINPFQLTFIRFLVGGLVLLPFSIVELKKRNLKLTIKDFGFLFFTGFLIVILCMFFFQYGIIYGKASTAALIFSVNPVFTIPFAYLILKEKFTKNTALSLLVSIIGLVIILNPFNLSPDFKGMAFSFLAAISFSLYTVVGKLKIKRYGGIILTCFSALFGDAILLILLLIFNIQPFANVNMGNIFQLLYLGIFVSGLGFIFYFKAMEETSTMAAAVVYFIKPALSPLLSLLILKEPITLNTMLGIVFVILGAYLSLPKKQSIKDKNPNDLNKSQEA